MSGSRVVYRTPTGSSGSFREKVGGWIKTRTLSLGEAIADAEFHGLAEDFKAKLVSLIKAYLENGVLSLDELR